MKHGEFMIGMEFMCGGKRWRCTDRGTRTVIAICLEAHPGDSSWYYGPPYAVAETVFDEDDFEACEPVDLFCGERQKTPMSDRLITSVPEGGEEEHFVPRTEFGKELWELRKKVLEELRAHHEPLLDAEGIRREVRERRGERHGVND